MEAAHCAAFKASSFFCVFFCLHSLCFVLAGLSLLFQCLGLCLLSLGLVDGLHEHALVLVLVTLGFHIEFVVDVLVDLLLLTVLAQQPAKNTQATHPKHLCGHPCLAAAAALSCTIVATLALGIEVLADAGA